MDFERIGRQTLLSWALMALLVALVCLLAVLQYRWIGEVSESEKRKLEEQLHAGLDQLSRSFNSEINQACVALLPTGAEVSLLGREEAYANRYLRWESSAPRRELFGRIAIAWEENQEAVLRVLDRASAAFVPAEWPAAWNPMRRWIARASRRPARPGAPLRPGGRPGGPAAGAPTRALERTLLIDVPRFGDADGRLRGELARAREQDWLLVEIKAAYARDVFLPDLLARYLGQDYLSEYQVEVTVRADPSQVIYRSDSRQGVSIARDASVSVALFDLPPQRPGGFGPGPGRPPRGAPGSGAGNQDAATAGRTFAGPGGTGRGRWLLSVRPQAGSLEAVVAQARRRNLAVSAALLLLLLATGVALLRFSRQAQRLAELEMEFVAGISHELRTPLTVIRTAAYNLRRKIAANPTQVERYGALIQQESEKLTAIVEQVLRFTGSKKGHIISERKPIDVESLIDQSLQSSKGVLEEALCQIEKNIEPNLPPILGDATSLRHVIQNLVGNAVKYGMDSARWIGIFARSDSTPPGQAVEIRVADRGPGIPSEEQKHIFDAFFRGNKAVLGQIHGTGLGLNLVKKIVEAHDGTIHVQSQPGAGTTFIVRIPSGPAEHQG